MRREDLEALSTEELAELLGTLEQAHVATQREDILAFARNTAIPGTPGRLSQNDLRSILNRKQALNRGAKETENEALETPDDEELYATKTDIARHQELILVSIQNLIEETPVSGSLSNGHRHPDGRPIAPDGLMLMLPPGAAKSSYGSVAAPAWLLGRYDGIDVISVSYAAELARRFGRRVRHIVRQPDFAEKFNATITEDNQAVDQWGLTNGSTYRAVGVLGGVTGNRADLVILDDPIAGREEAESEVIRDKTNAAIKDDVMTRLKPHGKVVMIMTRWHEADPMGVILGEGWDGASGLHKGTDGRWWLVLCMPLICERPDDPLGRRVGERLWPEWFTEKFVDLAKAAGERTFSSLYQQRPSASDGNILIRSWWRCWPHGQPFASDEQLQAGYRHQMPQTLKQCFLCYDTAIEEDESADYSAMTAWYSFELEAPIADKITGENIRQQHLLLAGAWRQKIQAADLIDEVLGHIRHFEPDFVLIEKRASGSQLIQELRKRRPRWVDATNRVHDVAIVEWLPPGRPGAKGKVPRAWSASTVLGEGTVWYLPGRAIEAALKEAAAFPNGMHDDLTDTITAALIYSRTANLLDLPTDLLDSIEEREEQRRDMEYKAQKRLGYGAEARTKPAKEWKRSLYG